MYKHQITKPSIKLCEAKSNPNSANNIINLNAKNNKIS